MAAQNHVSNVMCSHSCAAHLLQNFISLLFVWVLGRNEQKGIMGRDYGFKLCKHSFQCYAMSRF